jgi:hypothetical protein
MHTPGKRESTGAAIARAIAGEEEDERKGGGGGGGGASVSEGAASALSFEAYSMSLLTKTDLLSEDLQIGEEVEARVSGKKWYPAQITSKVHELGQLFYVISYHQATKGRAQVTPQQVQRSSSKISPMHTS